MIFFSSNDIPSTHNQDLLTFNSNQLFFTC